MYVLEMRAESVSLLFSKSLCAIEAVNRECNPGLATWLVVYASPEMQ